MVTAVRNARLAKSQFRPFRLIAVALACAALFQFPVFAGNVRVRYPEGVIRGFLALRSLDGQRLASGQLIQFVADNQVTIHLTFHFNDGSMYDELTVFSQRGTFRLLSDHLTERGPSFKPSMETRIDASTGKITVRYRDNGKEKTRSDRIDLPPDVSNGLLFTLLKDIPPTVPETTISYVAFTPKPRLIKLVITPEGNVPVTDGAIKLKAVHYRIKVKIEGIAGFIAGLMGKRVPDLQMWVLEGKAPAIVKFQGSLYYGGPEWQITPSSPALASSAH